MQIIFLSHRKQSEETTLNTKNKSMFESCDVSYNMNYIHAITIIVVFRRVLIEIIIYKFPIICMKLCCYISHIDQIFVHYFHKMWLNIIYIHTSVFCVLKTFYAISNRASLSSPSNSYILWNYTHKATEVSITSSTIVYIGCIWEAIVLM